MHEVMGEQTDRLEMGPAFHAPRSTVSAISWSGSARPRVAVPVDRVEMGVHLRRDPERPRDRSVLRRWKGRDSRPSGETGQGPAQCGSRAERRPEGGSTRASRLPPARLREVRHPWRSGSDELRTPPSSRRPERGWRGSSHGPAPRRTGSRRESAEVRGRSWPGSPRAQPALPLRRGKLDEAA